ncbi:GNAT family N-acetyltransferase [Halomonas mongoliensis]|uniref:GNAT family N-acetyltransferase n=1 Tax=Halomonas mongoliensis TaxID=321265 RepID=A0ABU1GL18_9GAMM|nr:GNAT family N-acetyltransferase [Halomonas mongoliensis]MDR5892227.1 GNAT family N-acetyltransferase [Halomonas mongoliensis]
MLVRLTEADLPALVALEEAQGWPMGGSESSLGAALADPAAALFGLMERNAPAEQGGLVGYAVAARLPFEAELQALLVSEARRGQGLARELLAAVVDQARGWGSERLLLEVRAGNAAAIVLYRRAGFQEDGRRRGYYPPLPGTGHSPETTPPRQGGAADAGREDALLMSLALAAGAAGD